MTSFAFIFGVLPLVWASGAGAEMRRVLGTVVFGGMLGVTVIGLFLTPVFYVVIRGLVSRYSGEPRPSRQRARRGTTRRQRRLSRARRLKPPPQTATGARIAAWTCSRRSRSPRRRSPKIDGGRRRIASAAAAAARGRSCSFACSR